MTGGPTVVGRHAAGRTVTSGAVPPLPDTLRVEVAAVGDLRCAMCLVHLRPPVNRLTAAMPLAMFRCLVDDLPGLRELTLQGMGEPLLTPNLVDMIRYAKGRGIRVAVDSNATLLSRDRAEELVEVGLDRLRVSLDGADPQGFDGVPEGAHFGPVLENLAGLMAARRAADRDEPCVQVVFVATPQNIGHLPDLVALLGGIGVGEVRVQALSPLVERLDPDGVLGRDPLPAGLSPVVAPAALTPGELRPGELRPGELRPSELRPGELRPATQQPPAELDPALAAKLFAEARLAAEEYALDLWLPEPGATLAPARSDTAYVTSDGQVRTCCATPGGAATTGEAATPGTAGEATARLGDHTFADLWAGHANRLATRRA